MKRREYFLYAKKIRTTFFQQFVSYLPLLITVAPFLRFCTERKHCTLFCIHLNARMCYFHSNQSVHTHRIRILALRRILNMLMFHVDVNMKLLGIRFKNDLFQCFRVESLFWETIALYTVHFQIEHFAGCFHSLWAVTHCMKGHFQKSIIGALCNSLVSLACIFIFARNIIFLPPKKKQQRLEQFFAGDSEYKASINVGVLRCSSFMFLLLNPQSSWPVYLHAKVFTVTTCFFKLRDESKYFHYSPTVCHILSFASLHLVSVAKHVILH